MRKATLADKSHVVTLLTDAFWNNLSVNYVISKNGDKRRKINALMAYSFNLCQAFGEVFVTDDMDGAALLLYPQNKRTTFLTIWWDIQLLFKSVGIFNFRKALTREKIIHRLQEQGDKMYIWFIGINPPQHGKGKGSKLLTEICQLAKQKHLTIYLETSTLNNLPWYKRFGLTIYNQHDFGYLIFFLRKI